METSTELLLSERLRKVILYEKVVRLIEKVESVLAINYDIKVHNSEFC